MSMQIAELSSETTKNETVVQIQKANKDITEFFTYVNEENPAIGAICRKYNFEEINF